MASKDSYIKDFSDLQKKFYTSFREFDDTPNVTIRKHGYVLMQGVAKGFPNLADIIGNLHFIDGWGFESPELLKALQHSLSKNRPQTVPSFIYFKSKKAAAPEKTSKRSATKNKEFLDFDKQTIGDICSALMIDATTYDYLKYTAKIQKLGREIVHSNEQKIIEELGIKD